MRILRTLLPALVLLMAVAHDAASESHTGTTGSASEASFSWTHTPTGTPKGVLVFTFTNANAVSVSSVTYGGVALTVVSGGRAVDAAGEPGDCKAWFLGSGVPTGAQTVVVNRNNNANVLYAIAVTVTAAADKDTSVHTAGIVLLEGDGTLAEQSVTDGSPGTNSIRYAGVNTGLAAPPAGGASSTALHSIDFGARGAAVVRETTAGQGARSVGFSSGTSDDRAAVHLAIKEAAAPARFDAAVSGSGTASAGLTTAIRFATSVQGSGALAGVLTTAIRPSASVNGSASVSGTLTSSPARFVASIAGNATVEAVLTTAIRCTASVTGTAVSAGALTTAIRLTGALNGTASLSAALTGGATGSAAHYCALSAMSGQSSGGDIPWGRV